MGTLRGPEDQAFVRRITEEVTNLFGTDVTLYRFAAADNKTVRDPIYDEPSCGHTLNYHAYPIKGFFFQYQDTPFAGEGFYSEVTSQGHIAFIHLEAAGVQPDAWGERLSEGDVILIHTPPNYGSIYYDIIQTTKDGFVNDTGYNTGYTFSMKRSTKFLPESKNLNG